MARAVRVVRAALGRAFVEGGALWLHCRGVSAPPFTVKKLECSKQAFAVNTLAWNNRIGLGFYFVGL